MGKAHELQPISLVLPVLVVAFHPLRVAGGWVLVGTRVSGEAKPRLKGWGIGVDAPPGASGARASGGRKPARQGRDLVGTRPRRGGNASPFRAGFPCARFAGNCLFVSATKP